MNPFWDNGFTQLYQGDARFLDALADESIDCVVTSPPYWNLRVYKGDQGGWLGNEPTPEAFLGSIVAVFKEVRRVLRPWGTCWIVIGDSMTGAGVHAAHHANPGLSKAPTRGADLATPIPDGISPQQPVGIPWKLLEALRADGWHVKPEIILQKAAGLPESVNGWRWEQHRVKVKAAEDRRRDGLGPKPNGDIGEANEAKYELCPGCSQCSPNDGLVLRKGQWRPTKAHEWLLMLPKGPGYYGDREAVRQPLAESSVARISQPTFDRQHGGEHDYGRTGVNPNRSARKTLENFRKSGNKRRKVGGQDGMDRANNHLGFGIPWDGNEQPGGTNLRSVWSIGNYASGFAHYATFHPRVPELCIKASTSEAGNCPSCGVPWARVVSPAHVADRPGRAQGRDGDNLDEAHGPDGRSGDRWNLAVKTLGFRPTCRCPEHEPVPAVVLDPFAGTGTTLAVAQHLGRRSIGVEISAEYLAMAQKRLEAVPLPLLSGHSSGQPAGAPESGASTPPEEDSEVDTQQPLGVEWAPTW